MNTLTREAQELAAAAQKTAPSFSARRLRFLEQRQRENVALNNREWEEKKTILSSTPQRIFLQINAVCNADCVFCSKGYDYPLFRIDEYREKYGKQVTPVLQKAREVILTGSGEFLGLPDAPKIIRYFNEEFPHVEKYVATNASHLKPEIVELIADSGSRYTLQLSLHGSDEATHKQMMRYNAYPRVMENIRRLMEARGRSGNLSVSFMFVMTTLNVENLPDFVRFAKEMGAERVLAGYFYIYESQQKYLSLYFKQDLANRIIDEARRVAEEVGIEVRLPHKFGQPPETAAKPTSCIEPWHQVMINPDGAILPCDVYGGFNENLNQKSFAEIWNGPAYRAIRTALRNGGGCLTTCPRHNPIGINDWRAHVIHRPKEDRQIAKEYREALRKP
ncbi:MAG: radical SAM protein [Elusimicrobia bacterium]|nr:radical SAM protein [Elusimicrobiota bacterium]MDE2314179.1 radical SAM protein [Elusimicrobiota bacterium]